MRWASAAMAAAPAAVKGEEERNGNGNAWLAGPPKIDLYPLIGFLLKCPLPSPEGNCTTVQLYSLYSASAAELSSQRCSTAQPGSNAGSQAY